MKNHSFPKTYTTAGAAYRAKKIYTERFEGQTFMVVKQDNKFLLECVESQQVVDQVVEATNNEIV